VSLRAGAADPYEQIARATNAADVHVVARPAATSRRCPHARRASAPPTDPSGSLGVQRAQPAREPSPSRRGRRRAAAAIDRPKLTDGRWLSGAPGEIVLDRTDRAQTQASTSASA
jgi:hypothetical protein